MKKLDLLNLHNWLCLFFVVWFLVTVAFLHHAYLQKLVFESLFNTGSRKLFSMINFIWYGSNKVAKVKLMHSLASLLGTENSMHLSLQTLLRQHVEVQPEHQNGDKSWLNWRNVACMWLFVAYPIFQKLLICGISPQVTSRVFREWSKKEKNVNHTL